METVARLKTYRDACNCKSAATTTAIDQTVQRLEETYAASTRRRRAERQAEKDKEDPPICTNCGKPAVTICDECSAHICAGCSYPADGATLCPDCKESEA